MLNKVALYTFFTSLLLLVLIYWQIPSFRAWIPPLQFKIPETDVQVPAISWCSPSPLRLQVFPVPIQNATMYSADRDLIAVGLRELDSPYQPVVADWESGAIAWVAHRNATPLLILRGVTDLVGPEKAEAEGNLQLFQNNTGRVMQNLVTDLPSCLLCGASYS